MPNEPTPAEPAAPGYWLVTAQICDGEPSADAAEALLLALPPRSIVTLDSDGPALEAVVFADSPEAALAALIPAALKTGLEIEGACVAAATEEQRHYTPDLGPCQRGRAVRVAELEGWNTPCDRPGTTLLVTDADATTDTDDVIYLALCQPDADELQRHTTAQPGHPRS